MAANMEKFVAELRKTEAIAGVQPKPVMATEARVATATVGGVTYNNRSVKHMCYADKGNDIFPDAEALAPAYALRLLSYVLLHWQNGFRDVQLWELAGLARS